MAHLLRCEEHFCEIVKFKKSFQDPTLLGDERVLANLLQNEDRYLPSPSYFKCVQKDIKPWMRTKVVKWMSEVCEEQRCEEEVFILALNYTDRFLSINNIGKDKLQLLGAVSIFIASKLKETVPFTADKLIMYAAKSITFQEIMEWELIVLTQLKWDLAATTPHDFLDHIQHRLAPTMPDDQSERIKRNAITYIQRCYASDFKFTHYPPSMIAAGCLSLATDRMIHLSRPQAMYLLQRLQQITSIEFDCLQACQEQVEKTVTKYSNERNCYSPSADSPNPEKPTTPTDVRDILV